MKTDLTKQIEKKLAERFIKTSERFAFEVSLSNRNKGYGIDDWKAEIKMNKDIILEAIQDDWDKKNKLFKCPTCNRYYFYRGHESKDFKCPKCQQRLKFSEEKEYEWRTTSNRVCIIKNTL